MSTATVDRAETLARMRTARTGPRRRRLVVGAALTVALVALVLVRALLGTYRISVVDAVRILSGEKIPGASFILMESTLPRALMGALVGMAFGAAGSAFQTMLRNPLASPDVLGLNTGASAGAVLAVVVLGLRGSSVTVFALVGALAVAVAILTQARRGSAATSRMILVGIALSALLSALVQWALVRADIYQAQDAMIWLTGSLNTVTWTNIGRAVVGDAVLLPAIMILARPLRVARLGDDLAAGLGVRVSRVRVGVVVVVVALVASATALVGPVAFVALLSGPVAARLVPGRPVPGIAALVGAVTVVGADYVAATVVPGTPLPVGVVTGLLGAPALLWLLHSRRTKEV